MACRFTWRLSPGVEAPQSVGPMMPMSEWNQLRIEHPDWARTVTTATRASLPAGAELTVNRLRAAALSVPIPDALDAATGGGVGIA